MNIRIIIWKPSGFLFSRLSWDILLQLFNNHFILILSFKQRKEAQKWEKKKEKKKRAVSLFYMCLNLWQLCRILKLALFLKVSLSEINELYPVFDLLSFLLSAQKYFLPPTVARKDCLLSYVTVGSGNRALYKWCYYGHYVFISGVTNKSMQLLLRISINRTFYPDNRLLCYF